MKTLLNSHYKPDPQEFNHVDDFTDNDFDEEDSDITGDDDCATTGSCMHDPEDFDD